MGRPVSLPPTTSWRDIMARYSKGVVVVKTISDRKKSRRCSSIVKFALGAESGKHNRDHPARHERISAASRDTFENNDLQDEPSLAIPTGSQCRGEADYPEWRNLPSTRDNIAEDDSRHRIDGVKADHDSLLMAAASSNI